MVIIVSEQLSGATVHLMSHVCPINRCQLKNFNRSHFNQRLALPFYPPPYQSSEMKAIMGQRSSQDQTNQPISFSIGTCGTWRTQVGIGVSFPSKPVRGGLQNHLFMETKKDHHWISYRHFRFKAVGRSNLLQLPALVLVQIFLISCTNLRQDPELSCRWWVDYFNLTSTAADLHHNGHLANVNIPPLELKRRVLPPYNTILCASEYQDRRFRNKRTVVF